jgi:hypothetical protein
MWWHFEGVVEEETVAAVASYPRSLTVYSFCGYAGARLGSKSFYDIMTRPRMDGPIYWHFPAFQPHLHPRSPVPALHILQAMAGTDPTQPFLRSPIVSIFSIPKPRGDSMGFSMFILHVKLELHHLSCLVAYLVP